MGAVGVVGYREAWDGDLTGHDEGGDVCDDSIFCSSGDGTSDLCIGHSGCPTVSDWAFENTVDERTGGVAPALGRGCGAMGVFDGSGVLQNQPMLSGHWL